MATAFIWKSVKFEWFFSTEPVGRKKCIQNLSYLPEKTHLNKKIIDTQHRRNHREFFLGTRTDWSLMACWPAFFNWTDSGNWLRPLYCYSICRVAKIRLIRNPERGNRCSPICLRLGRFATSSKSAQESFHFSAVIRCGVMNVPASPFLDICSNGQNRLFDSCSRINPCRL